MKKTKYQKKRQWTVWNDKLDRYDMIIDLANIKTLSQKALRTGKLSRKVIKKWKSRGRKALKSCSCSRKHKACLWLPSTVTNAVSIDKWSEKKHFWWRCLRCRCITAWVWEHELSESMLNAYKEHTKVYDPSDAPEDVSEEEED